MNIPSFCLAAGVSLQSVPRFRIARPIYKVNANRIVSSSLMLQLHTVAAQVERDSVTSTCRLRYRTALHPQPPPPRPRRGAAVALALAGVLALAVVDTKAATTVPITPGPNITNTSPGAAAPEERHRYAPEAPQQPDRRPQEMGVHPHHRARRVCRPLRPLLGLLRPACRHVRANLRPSSVLRKE